MTFPVAVALHLSLLGPATYSGIAGQTNVTVPRLDDAGVTIDGSFDESSWAQAATLTGFSEYTPVDGRPAEDSTEILVWYSPTAIYFGIRAFETHGAVHATLADRDRIATDDYVQILLDTFDDRRQALVFGVNPMGVQSDGTLTETQGGSRDTVDRSADFVYQSKGRVTDTGYDVEIRIPFKSIRFQQAKTQTWGINVVRVVQRSGQEQTWTMTNRGASSFLSQSGKLEGLTELHAGRALDIIPTLTSRVD
ncbi:MAG TPA: carbohydrate binding family 9 domain-containing protein, partial [Gemmatimonadales bacterium]|nr:carbohydrate binding family 9 domain-containing protein [Gemmatimonadales bacterium]